MADRIERDHARPRFMKSVEVYRTLREILDPYCTAKGYRRTKSSMPGWCYPFGGRVVVFWCQCSQDGWDLYAGSKFTVEFQLSDDPHIGTGTHRRRLSDLLSEEQCAQITAVQNDILGSLPRPPANHPLLGTSVAAYYLSRFEQVRTPYRPVDDIWLRYHGEKDIRRWGSLLLQELPAALRTFEETTLGA